MVYLTTIIHISVYAAFFFGFLANYIVWPAWAYLALLFLTLLQIIIDIAIMATPVTNDVIIGLANCGVLVVSLGLQTICVRLFHNWSSSMRQASPRHRHRFLVWSANTMHVLHFVIGIVGLVGLILLSNPATEGVGLQMWLVALWSYVALSLYLMTLEVVMGVFALREVTPGVSIARKRNQLIRLIFMTLFLAIFFISTAVGLYSDSLVVYVGGFSLYVILLIAVFPKALYGYDMLPEEREIVIDPDGVVNTNAVPGQLGPQALEEGLPGMAEVGGIASSSEEGADRSAADPTEGKRSAAAASALRQNIDAASPVNRE